MKTQWATHSKTALLHTHMHCRKGNQCGCLYGELHQAPTSHSVVSSYAVRSHTRLTCNTLQIMSINKQGMFYLKGRTLIQRHHSSTEKKCCLISVTPLLLPSSRKRERERGYVPLLPHRHLVSGDLSLPQWLKNSVHYYGFTGVAMGWT